MSRLATVLVGPEMVMVVATTIVYLICARHPSDEGRDIDLMERMVSIAPLIAVTLVFLTVFVPGSKTWWWLARAVAASFIGTAIFSYRIIEGFGEGAKGQDAAFMISYLIAGVTASLGAATTGALIHADQSPAFAEWFRMHPVAGTALTVLAAVPIGVGLFFVATTVGGLALGFWSVFRK